MQISYVHRRLMISFHNVEMQACLSRSQQLWQPTFHNVQYDLQGAVVLHMVWQSFWGHSNFTSSLPSRSTSYIKCRYVTQTSFGTIPKLHTTTSSLNIPIERVVGAPNRELQIGVQHNKTFQHIIVEIYLCTKSAKQLEGATHLRYNAVKNKHLECTTYWVFQGIPQQAISIANCQPILQGIPNSSRFDPPEVQCDNAQ